MIVLSPHLNDAVFGCGELIASRPGTVVVTVFAGLPADTGALPDWDADCGFSSPRQAIATRRREDREALELLEAMPCWLNCRSSQYRRTHDVREVALKVVRALRRHDADTIVVPLGLKHEDHKLAYAAALRALQGARGTSWLAYAEPNYRRIPGVIEERLAELESLGIDARPVSPPVERSAGDFKRRAVHCYASQLRGWSAAGRPGYEDVFAAERYWQLKPRP